jgi:hypothetical protein
LCAAELRRCAGVYRPVRTGCVGSADGSLTMIMLGADLEGCTQRHSLGVGILTSLIDRPLGYEANGTRPTPVIGSCGVLFNQGRSSMASDLAQLALP